MKLSKNSWHYQFWTKCMKNDFLHSLFGVSTKWDDALWDECYEQCNGGVKSNQNISVNELYDHEIQLRKIPQDLCSYMRNMMLMILTIIITGSIAVAFGLITLIGFIVVPFVIAEFVWASWFADSYSEFIALGVIAWLAFITFILGWGTMKTAKHYADNRFKQGTVSAWIHDFRLPSLKKGYTQPWYYIVYQYYCSIKEKTCKKIEFED